MDLNSTPGLNLDSDDPPFDHLKFKPNSNFSRVGPKGLESFIEANKRDLNKVPIRNAT